MSNEANYEIERRFLIRMPDAQRLSAMGESSSITQTYLKSEKGTTARVRRRGKPGDWTYTHTVKKRLSHIRREEYEREISREEYERLLENADERKRSIEKTRHCISYMGQLLEIDIFPFFEDRAILEIELEGEDQPITLPDSLCVIKEVTGDGRYTNAAMAEKIPYDEI